MQANTAIGMASTCLTIVAIIKLIQVPRLWVKYIQLLPLLVFLYYPSFVGMMTDLQWFYAFLISSIAALIVIVLVVAVKGSFEPVLLGANLFSIMGTVGFILDIPTILYLYQHCQAASFVSCIVLTNLAVLFFLEYPKKHFSSAQIAKLLSLNFCCMIWSIFMESYGTSIAAAIPFLTLEILQPKLFELENVQTMGVIR